MKLSVSSLMPLGEERSSDRSGDEKEEKIMHRDTMTRWPFNLPLAANDLQDEEMQDEECTWNLSTCASTRYVLNFKSG